MKAIFWVDIIRKFDRRRWFDCEARGCDDVRSVVARVSGCRVRDGGIGVYATADRKIIPIHYCEHANPCCNMLLLFRSTNPLYAVELLPRYI